LGCRQGATKQKTTTINQHITENNLFIQAAKSKLRFNTTRGQLTTEDLFDLNLKSLDAMESFQKCRNSRQI
jgi:hypothetical protein